MKLDPKGGKRVKAHTTEGRDMRAIMKHFDRFKRAFTGAEGVMKFYLPPELGPLTAPPHINSGEVSITK